MHIVAIAWGFVVLLMAAAEATSPQGTVLGAFFTLLLYGVLPLGIVLYILGTPGRKRARRLAQAREAASADGTDGAAAAGMPAGHTAAGHPAAAHHSAGQQRDGGGVAAGAPVTPERKEP